MFSLFTTYFFEVLVAETNRYVRPKGFTVPLAVVAAFTVSGKCDVEPTV